MNEAADAATKVLNGALAEVASAIETIGKKIIMEEEKFRKWKTENVGRKRSTIEAICVLQITTSRTVAVN